MSGIVMITSGETVYLRLYYVCEICNIKLALMMLLSRNA